MVVGPYRLCFYSHDMPGPPHVRVDRDDETAKFWLTLVALAYDIGFRSRELCDIQRIVSERSAEFLEAWNDYFGA